MKKLIPGIIMSLFNFNNTAINTHLRSVSDLETFIPKSLDDINKIIKAGESKLDEIDDISKTENLTYNNTFKKLDEIDNYAETMVSILSLVKDLYTQKDMRDTAEAGIITISNKSLNKILSNKTLYKKLKEYVENCMAKESLTDEQRYYIKKTMKDLKKEGLELPDEKLKELIQVKKNLIDLCIKFESNISEDDSNIIVTLDELAGVPQNILSSLSKTDDGKFIVKTDYPTMFSIFSYCTVENTRKRAFLLFNNKAYLKNEPVLNAIIENRDKMAKMLGYKSFSDFDIDGAMANDIETVEKFLNELSKKTVSKGAQEIKKFLEHYKGNEKLVDDSGLINAWNIAYIKDNYKKEALNLDDKLVSEYFPMENTIDQLLNIYEKFFNLKFKKIKAQLWHDDVVLIEAYQNNNLIGYISLDLHPRPKKFTHAACSGIVTRTKDQPCFISVMANFPKSTPQSPALLKFNDVVTFFHEFGHAVHNLLSPTDIKTLSGTSVKRDFVEMPSQMLENWMQDPEILKMVSKHYKTGERLPDHIIKTLTEIKKFDAGDFISRQIGFGLISLNFFKEGEKKNLNTLSQEISKKTRPYVAEIKDNHFYSSFGHLCGYGSKYYGYLWSQVFSADVFEKLKEKGLLNPEIGTLYAETVLKPGGTKDPNEILKEFLKREPNQDAFLRSMGLN